MRFLTSMFLLKQFYAGPLQTVIKGFLEKICQDICVQNCSALYSNNAALKKPLPLASVYCITKKFQWCLIQSGKFLGLYARGQEKFNFPTLQNAENFELVYLRKLKLKKIILYNLKGPKIK